MNALAALAFQLGVVVACSSRLDASQETAPKSVERTGAAYVVRFDGGDERLTESALAAVELVWPIVAEMFGVARSEPSKPLEVHLYRQIAGYEAAELRLTQGKFARNLAMAHHASRSAHVALQPPCADETLRAVGLPPQTLNMLAWEATHLARFELCPNFAGHPDWLVDGLAAYVAQRVSAKLSGREPHEQPFWANDMKRVQALAAADKLPSTEDLLAGRVADLDWRERYALRNQWFAFLAGGSRRAKLSECLAFARRTGGGAEYAQKVLAHATKSFGSAGAQFEKHVAGLAPQWDEVYRSLAPHGQDWLQIAFPSSNAIAWNSEPVSAAKFAISSTLRILPGGRGQLNLLFAREPRGFYSIAFVADQGFTVFDYDANANSWTTLADAHAPALRLGVATPVKVSVNGRKLTVRVDSQSWTVELPRALPDAVVWGLGAQAGPEGGATGSAGLWQALAVGE